MPKYKSKTTPDFLLIITTLTLLVIGLMMVYSASAALAEHKYDGDAFYFVKRQLLFAGLGVFAMLIIMNVRYWFWRSWAKIGLVICFILLILVLIPGVGVSRGGASSWLGIGAFSIQPSEFMKIAMIIFLAKYLSENQKRITSFIRGMLPSLLFVIMAFGIIMLQPDLGTGVVLVATCVVMIYTTGAKISHFAGLGLVGLAGLAGLVLSAPYRMDRITSFLNPWADPQDTGFQIIQSLFAIGPGGLLGFGIGHSRQKFQYLPEPQTDFIFSIISEELGFIGAVMVLLLFFLLLWRGVRIALAAPDLFGSLLAVGVIGMVMIQVMINIAVVSGLMPVTGITLPFLSYGGSSLTLTLVSIGILLNVSRYSKY